MTQLTEHFTLEEFLPNGPPAADLDPKIAERLTVLATTILEPARRIFNHPINVSSGYRSPEVNKKVGGAPNSDHLHGDAADIYAPASSRGPWRRTTRELYELLRTKFGGKWGQLILEDHRTTRGPTAFWIHVSNVTARHRGTELALYSKATGFYSVFDPIQDAIDVMGEA